MGFGLAALYFVFLFSATVFELYLWKREKISAYSIFNATFTLYYILTPLILNLFKGFLSHQSGRFISYIYSSSTAELYGAYFISVVSYAVIVAIYFLGKSFKRQQKLKVVHSQQVEKKSMRSIMRVGMFLFFIGSLSILIFFNELGGFGAALRFSNSLRGLGSKPEDFYGPMGALFRMLSFFILGSSYCIKVYSDNDKKLRYKILFYSSFTLSIMYLLFNAGRATIIFFLIPFVLEYIRKKKKNILATLLFIFVGTIFIANIFDIFLYGLSTGNIQLDLDNMDLIDNIIAVIQDLSFPYSNIILSSKMNEMFGFRFGQDYFIWIFDILPSRILNIIGITIPDFESINNNTSLFYYIMNPSRGGVPTDFITLGMRQLHVSGVIFNSFLFSIFALYIDGLSKKVHEKYYLIITRVDLLFFTVITNNDITSIMRNSLFIIILIIALIRVKRIKSHKNKVLILESN